MKSKPTVHPGKPETFLASLREGNSFYLTGLTAMAGGALSFETVIAAVQDACNGKAREMVAPGQDLAPKAVSEHQVIATFPAHAIYASDGRLFRVAYHMEGTIAVLDSEADEVTAEFEVTAGHYPEPFAESGPDDGPDDPDDVEEDPEEDPDADPDEVPEEASVRQEALVESQAQALVEFSPSGRIKHAKLNRAQNVIEGTTLITSNSSNGVNRKRKYSPNALKQIASMAEGIPAFANHVSPDMAFKPRDVRDLIGRHVNVRYDAANDRVTSDLQLLEHQAGWVFSLAERLGDQIGNSLVSKGLVRMEGDVEIVDEVVALRSGDLVTDPASTKGLFEAQDADGGDFFSTDRDVFKALAEAGPQAQVVDLIFQKASWTPDSAKAWATAHGFTAPDAVVLGEQIRLPITASEAPQRQTITLSPTVQAVLGLTNIQEATDMEFNAATIATFLKDNSDQQKQVAELLGYVPKGEVAKFQEAQATVTKLQESLTAVTSERDALKKKVDESDAKEAVAAKKQKLQEAIAAHDLGKQFGKVEGVVTETFLGTLMEHGDADWKGLLDDRLSLLKHARVGGQQPRSEGKPKDLAESGDVPVLDGLHSRLAAAITR